MLIGTRYPENDEFCSCCGKELPMHKEYVDTKGDNYHIIEVYDYIRLQCCDCGRVVCRSCYTYCTGGGGGAGWVCKECDKKNREWWDKHPLHLQNDD